MDSVARKAQALAEETVAVRRDLHMHPEIAFEESRTAGIVASRLGELGLDLRSGVGGTGVVALLEGARPGRTVLARADMDALPLQEEGDPPYRSVVDGAMHACGHDGHTAVLLSVARLLSECRAELAGRVVFVFQPAEEVVRGARAMLDDGALEGLAVAAGIGLHLTSAFETGRVALRPGPTMASADTFSLRVQGKGGHAAKPNETVDPVLVAAQIVTGLQALVAREQNPLDPAVISITSVHGGTAFNIIPESVELGGTLRTFDDATRSRLRERILAVAGGIAATFRASVIPEWREGSPVVVNDPEMTRRLRPVVEGILGEGGLFEREPLMAGDDMALWLQEAPGCYFHVGAGDAERGLDYPHHHPRFDLDEAALPLAVELLSRGILEFLR